MADPMHICFVKEEEGPEVFPALYIPEEWDRTRFEPDRTPGSPGGVPGEHFFGPGAS